MTGEFKLPSKLISIPYRPDGWKHPDVRILMARRTRRGLKMHEEKYDGDKVYGVQFDDIQNPRLLSKAECEEQRLIEREGKECHSKS